MNMIHVRFTPVTNFLIMRMLKVSYSAFINPVCSGGVGHQNTSLMATSFNQDDCVEGDCTRELSAMHGNTRELLWVSLCGRLANCCPSIFADPTPVSDRLYHAPNRFRRRWIQVHDGELGGCWGTRSFHSTSYNGGVGRGGDRIPEVAHAPTGGI